MKRARLRKVMILLPGVPRRCSSWWRPGRWRTMTAASETETLSRETPALPPTPPEGALTTPLREDGETGGTRWLRLAAQAPPGPCPVPCRREVPVPALGGGSCQSSRPCRRSDGQKRGCQALGMLSFAVSFVLFCFQFMIAWDSLLVASLFPPRWIPAGQLTA